MDSQRVIMTMLMLPLAGATGALRSPASGARAAVCLAVGYQQ